MHTFIRSVRSSASLLITIGLIALIVLAGVSYTARQARRLSIALAPYAALTPTPLKTLSDAPRGPLVVVGTLEGTGCGVEGYAATFRKMLGIVEATGGDEPKIDHAARVVHPHDFSLGEFKIGHGRRRRQMLDRS